MYARLSGPAFRAGREQAERVLPGLVEFLRGPQLDVPGRRFGAEQIGEDALAVVGIVEEQEQVAQADQRVGAVGRPGQRVRTAVYVAHHVDSHVTTVSRPKLVLPSRATWLEGYRARIQYAGPGADPGDREPR